MTDFSVFDDANSMGRWVEDPVLNMFERKINFCRLDGDVNGIFIFLVIKVSPCDATLLQYVFSTCIL